MPSLNLNFTNFPENLEVSIPGSKSYTNRALIIASLSDHSVMIENPLFSDDTKAMIDCLRILEVKIDEYADKLVIHGFPKKFNFSEYRLNANLSGTTIRFILAFASLVPAIVYLEGKESLNKRPIKDLVEGLSQLGSKIEYLENEGFPPLKVLGGNLNKNKCELDGGVSSQYFTALMLIAPRLEGLEILVRAEQISKSYIDMTVDTMRQFGVKVDNLDYKKYIIRSQQTYNLDKYTVEGDFSACGYFAGIASLTKTKIKLNNLNPKSLQGDFEFLKILEKMGNVLEYDDNSITFHGSGVKAVDMNMENCPDQAQTLAVLLAFAEGKSVLTGVRSLRVKETERVVAVQTELAKMSIKTESPDIDTLIIYGGNPQSAIIDTYHDHRMAMSFAQAGFALKGMVINDPEVVTKTFPNFWEVLESLGMEF